VMKQFLFILGCILGAASIAFSQQQNCNINWGEPIMISNPAGDSYSPRIALSGDDTIHITWQFDGEVKLPYRRSIDGGNTFEQEMDLIHDTIAYPYYAYKPFILTNGNIVYLLFIAGTSGLGDEPIRMLKSHDGGSTWDDIVSMTSDITSGPDYATNNGDTLLVMYKNIDTNDGRLIVSIDGGESWNRIYYSVDYDTRIGITKGIIHATSRTVCSGSEAGELLYARSTDLGTTWSDTTLLSLNDGYFSELSSIEALEHDNITEIWTAWRDDKYGVRGYLGASMLSRQKINNDAWQCEQRLTDEPEGIVSSLASNGRVHTISWWHEVVPFESAQVVVRATQSSLNSFCPVENITPHKYTGAGPMVKLSSHAIHVVWEQLDEDGLFHIYYRKGEFAQTNAAMLIPENSHLFDTSEVISTRSDTIQIQNPGGVTLNVGTVICDDSNFTATPLYAEVGTRQQASILVTFNPKSAGEKNGKVIFYHDGPTSPDYVSVSGVGRWQTVSASYVPGQWSLVSMPMQPPGKLSLPYLYRFDLRYTPIDSMKIGKGYWAKPAGPVTYEGIPIYDDTILLKKGWNIIGALANPLNVNSIVSDPPDNLASFFYEYFESSYVQSDTLKPGYGYWVKAKENGKLILQGTRKKE
jgi:hypothetical protein